MHKLDSRQSRKDELSGQLTQSPDDRIHMLIFLSVPDIDRIVAAKSYKYDMIFGIARILRTLGIGKMRRCESQGISFPLRQRLDLYHTVYASSTNRCREGPDSLPLSILQTFTVASEEPVTRQSW